MTREVKTAWNEGLTMTLHSVEVGGTIYRSAWDAWTQLKIGTRAQCIAFRKDLKLTENGRATYTKSATGEKFDFTLIPFISKQSASPRSNKRRSMTSRGATMTKQPVKRYNYSGKEQAILSALSRPGHKVTSTDMMEELWGKEDSQPLYARQAIHVIIGNLIRKIERNGEPFRINRTKGNGPVPHVFWKESR